MQMRPIQSSLASPIAGGVPETGLRRSGPRAVLLQLRRDGRKRRVELGPEPLDHADDRHGNPGSDQAVLNGRRARFVAQKCLQLRRHGSILGEAP
jgi:hypothetical protein